MTQQHAAAQKMTNHRETGRPMPRVFTQTAWWRFSRDRRRRYLAQLPGLPSNERAATIETLVRLEWCALKAEATGSLMADREAREHRRLYQRLLADFERSIAAAAAPRPPSLAEVLAADTRDRLARERGETAA